MCADTAQDGDLRSSMTVTGLPSTPSLKLRRHPQARRPCTKPFKRHQPIILQEPEDPLLELSLLHEAHVRLADLAVAADEQRGGEPPDGAERLLDVFPPESDEHGGNSS